MCRRGDGDAGDGRAVEPVYAASAIETDTGVLKSAPDRLEVISGRNAPARLEIPYCAERDARLVGQSKS